MKSNAVATLVNNAFAAAVAAVDSGAVTTSNLFSASQRRYADNIRKAAEDKAAKKVKKVEKKLAKTSKKLNKVATKAAKKAAKAAARAEGAHSAPLSEVDLATLELAKLRQTISDLAPVGRIVDRHESEVKASSLAARFKAGEISKTEFENELRELTTSELRKEVGTEGLQFVDIDGMADMIVREAVAKTIEDGQLTGQAIVKPATADESELTIFDIDSQAGHQAASSAGSTIDAVVEKNADANGPIADAMRKANAAKPSKQKK